MKRSLEAEFTKTNSLLPASRSIMRYGTFIIFILFLLLSYMCFGDTQPKPTGVFTKMHYNAEGGDVLGLELFVVYSNYGYYVIYQSSEGEPSMPIVIPAIIEGMRITFEVPASIGASGSFEGVISSAGLIGTFSENQQTVHLKRTSRYWQ
jgi:TRAP-type uncharacterized transport system fused permease subunit